MTNGKASTDLDRSYLDNRITQRWDLSACAGGGEGCLHRRMWPAGCGVRAPSRRPFPTPFAWARPQGQFHASGFGTEGVV